VKEEEEKEKKGREEEEAVDRGKRKVRKGTGGRR